MQTPRTEFAQALRAIATERGLDPSVILDTIKQAIVAAYRRDAREQGIETEEMDYDVELNSANGEARIFGWPLEKPDKKTDVTPPGFGRIAAQTAKQVIHQKIREAEKASLMDEYSGRVGTLISGMILRFDGPDVRIDLGRAEGTMPKEERVPSERLNPSQRLSFLLKEIKDSLKGKQLILSRADSMFVQKLFEREVPEMSSGSVEVKAISREPGVRTKMAVFSNQSGVDPVGSCVGQKGVRVQAVTNELGGERVDIIQYTEDMDELVKAALAPADGLSVKLDKKNKIAVIKAPEDQLSLAIGKDGQNARLAAKLTGWKIEIKPQDEVKIPKGKKAATKGAEKPAEGAEKVEQDSEPEDKPQETETELEKAEKKPARSASSSPASNATRSDAGRADAGGEDVEVTSDEGNSKTDEEK